MGHALDTVNKFLLEQDTSVLANDFRFVGPVDQKNGKEAFLELTAEFNPLINGMRMLKQFESGNQVCSIYEMDLQLPSGKGLTLKVADWVTVEAGKMIEEHILYDPREFVAAMSGQVS